MTSIKDLIYFDYDKAKSINSQINGGLVSEITRAIENEGQINPEIGIDFKIIKAKIGGSDRERNLKTEKIELYHELLNEVESALSKKNTLTDLNISYLRLNSNDDAFLRNLPELTYIKATGFSSFEDNERFKRIMLNFNEMQRLIYASVLDKDPEIQKSIADLNELKRQFKKNSNQKDLSKLILIEKNFDKIIQERSKAVLLDEVFIERFETILNTFTPNRLNFRLAPIDTFKNFQILSNLKSQYLVNGDFENIIYTYGSRPNIKLTVFGIITSCPSKTDNRVNVYNDFEDIGEGDIPKEVVFEKAFRNVFSAFEGFEKFFFVPSYPKVAISPIAIYREVKL